MSDKRSRLRYRGKPPSATDRPFTLTACSAEPYPEAMKRATLLLVLVCLGCDSMPTMPMRDPLTSGVWVSNFTVTCSAVLSFDAGGTYALSNVCELQDGSIGASQERGTYAHVGDQLTRTPTESACGAQPSTVPVMLSDKVLSVDGQRYDWEPSDTATHGTPGCVDAAGNFTPL